MRDRVLQENSEAVRGTERFFRFGFFSFSTATEAEGAMV